MRYLIQNILEFFSKPIIWILKKFSMGITAGDSITIMFIGAIAIVFIVAFISVIIHSLKKWNEVIKLTNYYKNNYVNTERKTIKLVYLDYLYSNEEIADDSERPHYASILTMLGILGTFVGISFALNEVDLNMLAETEKFKDQIGGVFKGMKTAFITSLVGISTSIFYLISTKLFSFIITIKINRERKNKWINYEVETAEYFLRQQGDNVAIQRQAAEILKNAGESFTKSANSLKEVMNQIGDTISPEKLGEIITDGINKALKEEIKPVFQDIKSELSILSKMNENQDQIANSIDDFNGFLKNDLQNIFIETRDIAKITFDTIEKNNSQISDFSNTIKAFSVGIIKTRKIMENFIDRSEQHLSKIFNNIIYIQSEFQNTMNQNQEKFEKSIFNTLENSIKQMENFATTLTEGLNRSSKEINNNQIKFSENITNSFDNIKISQAEFISTMTSGQNTFIETINTYQEVTNEKIEGFISTLDYKINDIFSNIKDVQSSLENSLITFKDTVHLQLLTFHNEFMEQVTQKVKEAFKEVEKEKDELRKSVLDGYKEFIDELMEEQKTVYDEYLGKYSEDLSQTISDFKEVFQNEYENRVEMLEKSSDITDKLLNVVNTSEMLFNSQKGLLGDFANQSVQAFNEMEKSNKMFLTSLSSIKKSLEKVGDAISDEVKNSMIDHFQSYHDSQEKYMKTTDTHIEGILQHILSTTTDLREISEKK